MPVEIINGILYMRVVRPHLFRENTYFTVPKKANIPYIKLKARYKRTNKVQTQSIRVYIRDYKHNQVKRLLSYLYKEKEISSLTYRKAKELILKYYN